MPRPVGNSKATSQLLASLDSKSFFGGFTEKHVLNYLLKNPQPASQFPFIAARDELNRQRSDQQNMKVQRLRLQTSLKPSTEIPDPSKEALELMRRPSVLSKDLDSFLKSAFIGSSPQSELRQNIDRGLMDMISASSPNNLRALMHYLSKYWQVGLHGVRPSIQEARSQARMLLLRAIEIHPQTQYEGGGEQTGLPDFHRFQQFVNNFFSYFGLVQKPTDELNDLVLQLCAKSGPLRTTTDLVMERSYVDEPTLQVFLAAVSASHPTVESLLEVRSLLLNEKTGPTAVNFLLNHVKTNDELLYVLEISDRSTQKLEVYEQCQTGIIETVMKIDSSVTNLALMFGILERIRRVSKLNSKTLDTALEASMKSNNVSATNRLLSEVEHKSPVVDRANNYVHR